jgi:hypothetical protein
MAAAIYKRGIQKALSNGTYSTYLTGQLTGQGTIFIANLAIAVLINTYPSSWTLPLRTRPLGLKREGVPLLSKTVNHVVKIVKGQLCLVPPIVPLS